ncbi:hypothetical protein ACJMK2_036269 [Sinanodonta woodiana]|uniref:PLD phosphodiesterase domain-containing protein n=1 Tax=Sinanodonta woodiana TaxID=1069815 RepID=A0ABD3WK25_SINWO
MDDITPTIYVPKEVVKQHVKLRSLILSILFLVFAIALVVGVTMYCIVSGEEKKEMSTVSKSSLLCQDHCVLSLVESIPENLTFHSGAPSHMSTYSGLQRLISLAEHSIEIASFYWTLLGDDIPFHDSSAWQGEALYKALIDAGQQREVKIKIAQNKPEPDMVSNDTINLAKLAGAEVRTLDFERLVGGGILHTKMWLIDRQHFYIGSANLDWRSMTQVKELGTIVMNCSCLASDLGNLFDIYWYLGDPDATVPKTWPSQYDTNINSTNPLNITFNETMATTYLSSSPPPFCASGRTVDSDAIVSVINNASSFVYVAVMDYLPQSQFLSPTLYWPVIDDALRRAAVERPITVRLLGSFWKHTPEQMIRYLHSLETISSYNIKVEVKLFEVPAYTEAQRLIPYARVNHNKYMVTDKTAYIGTSNWSADYFVTTGGIAIIVNQPKLNGSSLDVRQQLEDIFLRDWNSQYAFPLSHYNISKHT